MPPTDAPIEPPTPPATAAVATAAATKAAPDGAGAAARPRKPRRWRRILARIVEVGAIVAVLAALPLWCSVPNTAPLAAENPTTTAFIDLRRAQAADAGRRFDLKWEWRPIGQISRYLRAAVIYAEDMKFYQHDGVDWGAMKNAVTSNWDQGGLAIGGSTITQQLAKNLYLSPSRSLIRKAREMLIAYALEDHLSKQRILELYLNIVEWGDGVFGAEAAARRWFGHSAIALSPAEATRLAIALPNPFQRAPNVKSPMLTQRAVRIVHLLRIQGLIDEAQERAALDQVGAPEEKTLPTRGQRGETAPKPPTATTPTPTTPTPTPPPTEPTPPTPTSPTEPTPAPPPPPAPPEDSSKLPP